MHITSLRKVGGSVMLAVPPAVLEMLQLREGAKVGVTVENRRLGIESRKRPRYSMDELLAKCNSKAPRAKQDSGWIMGRRAGRELL